MSESIPKETAEETAARHLRERQDRALMHFGVFTNKVHKHYIRDPNCMAVCYPENIQRYRENIDFWRQQLTELGLLEKPDVQELINATQAKISSMLNGEFAPIASTETGEQTTSV